LNLKLQQVIQSIKRLRL